ncbi:MAG TPA: hypothetical protein VJY62_03560 [Bacteroidia bacterium]|nr:hypothetical protein [Bacteroidia bacterium]
MKFNSVNPVLKVVWVLMQVFVLFNISFSQPATFMRMYNRGNNGYAVREVNANSFVVAGGTDFYFNWHWHIMSPLTSTGIHFFSTDNSGNLLWEKIYNRLNERVIARWFEPTQDGGYIITGFHNKDIVWPPDSNDIVLVKTDANGAITWSKIFDTGKDELGYGVRQTADGGYIVSGFHDAAPVSLFGNTYAILIKTDANGNIQWEKKYQIACRDLGTAESFTYVVRQTADGGYAVVGTTVSTHPADLCVFRTDGAGNLLWAKSYDHDNTVMRFSVGLDIIESSSGDFIIAGAMDQDHMAMKNNYPYILKISSTGAFITAKFLETNPLLFFQSGFSSAEQTPDGGFFFCGMGGYSDFGDQAQLLKTDVNFNMQWSRVYSWDGIATMGSQSGRLTSDGGYIFTGKRQMAGTVLLKTNEVGLIPCKNPGTHIEFIPNIIVQNWNPGILTGINAVNIVLNTQSPLADMTTVCPLSFTLPVELTYFSASPLPEKEVQLEWITASEINNDYFLIEKSMDGMYFEQVARIKGAGNSTITSNYTFTDKHGSDSRILYYRLKQVDYNGNSDFSKIVPVTFTGQKVELVSTYVDHHNQLIKIFIKNNAGDHARYKFTDMVGKTISQGSQALTKGVSWITIDGKNLTHGIYYFSFQNKENFLTCKIFY